MKNLIKAIRNKLGMSQENLAKEIGVSPITVNRWENDKSYPSGMAQQRLYDICVAKNIDMSEYIVKELDKELDKESDSASNCLTLYHASRIGIKGDIKPISRSRCDFGRGFYMGTDPLQPLTLVCNEENPQFYTLEVETEGLKILNVEIDIEWAMLIAYNRGYITKESGSVYDKYAHLADGYDMVVGYIADDRMYQVLTDFFEFRITDTALVESLSALKLGKQYVAITEKACKKIKIAKSHSLDRLECNFLIDRSEQRRREGKRLADDVVREHRRDGRYFDEILKEATI